MTNPADDKIMAMLSAEIDKAHHVIMEQMLLFGEARVQVEADGIQGKTQAWMITPEGLVPLWGDDE